MDVITDAIVKWVPYTKDEVVCGRYPLNVWHRAVHDIDSDEEFASFLTNFSDVVKCYILKTCHNDRSVAFLMILNEKHQECPVVSVHGGGWESPLQYYRGYVLMLKHLLEQGFKVRTYCQLTNPTAIRFSRSVGFVPYRYSEEKVFMWINMKRLKSSKLFQRFYL